MEIDKKRYLKLSTKDRSYHIKIRVEYLMDQLDLVCGHMHISKPPSEEFINDLWKSLDEMIYEQVKEAKELRSILDQGAVGKA